MESDRNWSHYAQKVIAIRLGDGRGRDARWVPHFPFFSPGHVLPLLPLAGPTDRWQPLTTHEALSWRPRGDGHRKTAISPEVTLEEISPSVLLPQCHFGKQLCLFSWIPLPPPVCPLTLMFQVESLVPVSLIVSPFADLHFCNSTYACVRSNCYDKSLILFLFTVALFSYWYTWHLSVLPSLLLQQCLSSWLQNGHHDQAWYLHRTLPKHKAGILVLNIYLLTFFSWFREEKIYLCRISPSLISQNSDVPSSGHWQRGCRPWWAWTCGLLPQLHIAIT